MSKKENSQLYFHYWGKCSKEDPELFHLLPYHCLDVAAVALCWLNHSSLIRQRFIKQSVENQEKVIAWVLFFIALHDLGKFDVRFQNKASQVALRCYGAQYADSLIKLGASEYWHGEYACYWLFHDLADRLGWRSNDFLSEAASEYLWQAYQPWIRAVAGHHGMEPPKAAVPEGRQPLATPALIDRDRTARVAFIEAMEGLFLHPAGISIDQEPPSVDLEFLAGFCAVCDWLGSTVENSKGEARFTYCSAPKALDDYFTMRLSIANDVLEESGLLARSVTKGGMAALFPEFSRPHQVQTLVEELPTSQSLAIIEAPTGSGKTETALAYAARLLAAGEAESIIFALPTQATADAMLERIVKIADRIFDNADVVLAHGKSRFNTTFIDLKKAIERDPNGNKREREAAAQCARWLSESRKRVFLGQIGVCTIDQVLVSALPVRHRFVRGFGLGKSVLIIDEVHAYDAYMYGLLDKVLRHQRAMGGSAILLSATLPLTLRRSLVKSWGGEAQKLNADNDYPLITRVENDTTELYSLPECERQRLIKEQKKSPRDVQIKWRESADMMPDEALEREIIKAATDGVNVVLICNLVADAQVLAARLKEQTDCPVILFHSRYRFKDRQTIQQKVMNCWGKGGQRPAGAILVATQVVEQSLDIDFDWMITQLCPVDLLFQRLGRLHRHNRTRPVGFEQPKCTVLLPAEHRYELHKRIYGNGDAPNSRVLWRTEQMVRRHPQMRFPDVYRPVIELVYAKEAWQDEPDWIVEEYEKYWQAQYASRLNANRISNMENAWNDDDSHVSLLTRDGEMSLNIVPFELTKTGRCFLGEVASYELLEECQKAEQIMRNTIPAPASWRRFGLPEPAVDGLIWLPMEQVGKGLWEFKTVKGRIVYTETYGLRMEKYESAD